MSKHVHTGKCSAMLGDLSEYIDGSLQAEICAQIEEHMKTCDNCRVVVNTLRKTVELYEHCSDNVELPGEVKERLFAKLELNDYLSKADTSK
ncbi:MAG: zf-HC2 domain-containing protein [Anaerolineae bacterium]|nr:zf-HC2 domain-containing protein [Anaerolineae bacterium]